MTSTAAHTWSETIGGNVDLPAELLRGDVDLPAELPDFPLIPEEPVEPDPPVVDKNATYTYDELGQLAKITSDSATVYYTYGPTGLRSSKTVNGKTTCYVWDGDRMVMEYGLNLLAEGRIPESGTLDIFPWIPLPIEEGVSYRLLVDGIAYTGAASSPLFSRGNEDLPADSGWRQYLNLGGLRFENSDLLSTTQVTGAPGARFRLSKGEENWASTYLYGLGLVAGFGESGTRYYQHNAHGDVVQLTSTSGSVVKTYDYDAFGNQGSISPTDKNPFRYCGEYYDYETDSYYLRARYYTSRNGRFTQEDTVHSTLKTLPNGVEVNDPLSLNFYTYCYNNPIRYRDPNGHMAVADDALALIVLAGGTIYAASSAWVNSPEGQSFIQGATVTIINDISWADAINPSISAIITSANSIEDALRLINEAKGKKQKAPSKTKDRGDLQDGEDIGDLKRLPDKKVEEKGGEEWTRVLKGKNGKSGSDLYWNPKTGRVYTIPKNGGSPQFVYQIGGAQFISPPF